MRQKLQESIAIPSGIQCELHGKKLTCKSGKHSVVRNFDAPLIEIKIAENAIHFSCHKGNKIQFKKIKSCIAHMKNIFLGLEKPFVYKMQACNVHFPMTLKLEKNHLLINNFLGEKKPRIANLPENVVVDVKGQSITISSADKEAAGKTATNIEKATIVRKRDRRIFQDGIYITDKPEVLR